MPIHLTLGLALGGGALSCHETVVFPAPPSPDTEDRGAVLVVQGSESRAFGFAVELDPDEDIVLPPVVTEGEVQASWTTFACSPRVMGLPEGVLQLQPTPADAPFYPPPRSRYRLEAGQFVPDDGGLEEDLRRLPLEREDLCDAVASTMSTARITLRGGNVLDQITDLEAVRLNESQALIFRYRSSELTPGTDAVVTATTAQVHLLDLDGDTSPPSTRVPEIEALPVVGVEGLGDDQLALAGGGELVWYDWASKSVVERFFHPALEGAPTIHLALDRSPDGLRGFVLTDTEPDVRRENRDIDSIRTLLQLSNRTLTVVDQATVPYRANRSTLLRTQDGYFVRGLLPEENLAHFLTPQGELIPEALPEQVDNRDEIFEQLGVLYVVPRGIIFARDPSTATWVPVNTALRSQVDPFSRPERAVLLRGRVFFASQLDGVGYIAEQLDFGPCGIERHPVGAFSASEVFEERGVWALIPLLAGSTGERTTAFLFTLGELSPRCQP